MTVEGQRRQRLLARGLPLAALAAAAFAAGLLAGSEDASSPAAERFATAWEAGDLATMHAQLSPEAAQRHELEEFSEAYAAAGETATLEDLDVGSVDVRPAEGGGEVAIVPVHVQTRVFGPLDAELHLPLAGDALAWEPHLAFPGLLPGEELSRRVELPERAPILAADGTPLAEGPAGARTSALGTAALDAVGETGQPAKAQAEELARLGFPDGASAGTSGLELAFDQRLAGRPGGALLAVPAARDGGVARVLVTRSPAPGKPIHTTIDPALQSAAVEALAGRFGGVAALDARTGEVLALAGIALTGAQPPGSTFKIVTTAAALEGGVVELDEEFPVVSSVDVEGRELANAHDELCGGTFVQAFAHSCNSVFAPLGVEIGSERLVDTAERFGFNQPPQLMAQDAAEALSVPPSSIPPTIPSDLDLAVTAIGQGQVLATPLQMASVAQAVANGGLREPNPLVSDASLAPEGEATRVMTRQTALALRDLMIAVVSEGTGAAAALPNAQVAGKTGTAELGPKPLEPGEQLAPDEEPEQKIDAWFTGFAPALDPRLAVAAMVVDAPDDGGVVAAPIVQAVLAAGLGA